MYGIFKANRRFNTKTFTTYEATRSYVRKHIRKNANYKLFNTIDNGWMRHSNPSINTYKFAVRTLA